MKAIPGGVTAPRGFQAAGAASGVKKDDRSDLALITAGEPCPTVGVFTANRVKAHPVLDAMEKLEAGKPIQAVLINSGCANACTGPEGMDDLLEVTSYLSQYSDIRQENILTASTGVIGERLHTEKMIKALPGLYTALSPEGGAEAARAIMTTDTRPKEYAVEVETSLGRVTIGGAAKGAGMLNPNLATMLAVITTDAKIEDREALGRILSGAAEISFNRVDVDGDTSTNDCVFLMAGGASGIDPLADDVEAFTRGVEEVCLRLAVMLAEDAEGATKLVTIMVRGAADETQAEMAARAVAESPLVKTAFFGEDPNWGRIMAALGFSGADFDPEKVAVNIGGLELVSEGRRDPGVSEEDAAGAFRAAAIDLEIILGEGPGTYHLWTSDLSRGYVDINASYRS